MTHDWFAASEPNRRFATGLARAFAGALIFSLPMLMTMEMWWLGFYMDRWRLILLLVVLIPLLTGLSYYSGFEDTTGLAEDAIDALVAFAVGCFASVVILAIFGIIGPGMAPDEIVGKVALQAVPASIGGLLARSQMSGGGADDAHEDRKRAPTYAGELFLMAAGALFLALNVAPTEEMVLIAYKMEAWQGLLLALLSLLVMHAFVYSVEFEGQEARPESTTFWRLFLRFTVVGYALCLIMSWYVLWSFGRTDGVALAQILDAMIVLGFPAAIGAAAARLIL